MKRLLATALAVGLVAASVVPALAGPRARGRAIRRGVSVYNRFGYGTPSPVVSPRFARGYHVSPTYFYQAPVVYSAPAIYQAPVVRPPVYGRPAPPVYGWPARERAWCPATGQPPAPGYPAAGSDANNLRETREEMP